jgi:acetyl-CoA synthetase
MKIEGNPWAVYTWPGIARTIWGDHQRYKETYFTAFRQIFHW